MISTQARVYELLARLLREVDREAAIHSLLTSCLQGPEGFGALLPHLPTDLADQRARIGSHRRASELDRTADALERAAFAVRHAPDEAAELRAARPFFESGGAISNAVALLRASTDPYYQGLGALLGRELAPVEKQQGVVRSATLPVDKSVTA